MKLQEEYRDYTVVQDRGARCKSRKLKHIHHNTYMHMTPARGSQTGLSAILVASVSQAFLFRHLGYWWPDQTSLGWWVATGNPDIQAFKLMGSRLGWSRLG